MQTHFEALERRPRKARTIYDLDIRPIHDAEHLALFHLMKRFAPFPNVRVFALPVERWPATMREDFERLFLAESEVGRKFSRFRRANSLVRLEGTKAIGDVEEKWREAGKSDT